MSPTFIKISTHEKGMGGHEAPSQDRWSYQWMYPLHTRCNFGMLESGCDWWMAKQDVEQGHGIIVLLVELCWLVVWNIFIFPYIGFLIIPTDFHIFQRDWKHQPDNLCDQPMNRFFGPVRTGCWPFVFDHLGSQSDCCPLRACCVGHLGSGTARKTGRAQMSNARKPLFVDGKFDGFVWTWSVPSKNDHVNGENEVITHWNSLELGAAYFHKYERSFYRISYQPTGAWMVWTLLIPLQIWNPTHRGPNIFGDGSKP